MTVGLEQLAKQDHLVKLGLIVCRGAHFGIERKWTNEPYSQHPERVAQAVMDLGLFGRYSVLAALLHDVVEDTTVTISEIRKLFGPIVMYMVRDLTDQSEGKNRAERKRNEADRLARCDAWVQTIKVCDLNDNAKSIFEHDPKFAEVFAQEYDYLLGVLTKADDRVIDIGRNMLEEWENDQST